MSKPKRQIPPHEPSQPLVGLKESVKDAQVLERLWNEKQKRARKAAEFLLRRGVRVIGPANGRKRKRTVANV